MSEDEFNFCAVDGFSGSCRCGYNFHFIDVIGYANPNDYITCPKCDVKFNINCKVNVLDDGDQK